VRFVPDTFSPKSGAMVWRMPIKLKAKSKEEIPAELQALYVEREGELMLDVEGVVEKAKHDEAKERRATQRKLRGR